MRFKTREIQKSAQQTQTGRNKKHHLKSGVTGAGEGNRTLVFSLEGCCSTIELHPQCAAYALIRHDLQHGFVVILVFET